MTRLGTTLVRRSFRPLVWICLAGLSLGSRPQVLSAEDLPTPMAAHRKVVDRAAASIQLVNQRHHTKSLLIDYPWHAFAQASVEVRLITENASQIDKAQILPMYFVAQHFHNTTKTRLYACQNAAQKGKASQRAKIDGSELEILGRYNTLDLPAVCVAQAFSEKDDDMAGAAASFPLLQAWAPTPRMLLLDLPHEYFDHPGRLHIWFLRGTHTVWSQTLDWPGYAAR